MAAVALLEDGLAQSTVVEGVARWLRVARFLCRFERRVHGTLCTHEDGPLVGVILRARQAIVGSPVLVCLEIATAVAQACLSTFSEIDGVAGGCGVAQRLHSLIQEVAARVGDVGLGNPCNNRTPRQEALVAKVGQRFPAPQRRHRRARNHAAVVGKRLARPFIVGHGVDPPTAARQPQVGAVSAIANVATRAAALQAPR